MTEPASLGIHIIHPLHSIAFSVLPLLRLVAIVRVTSHLQLTHLAYGFRH